MNTIKYYIEQGEIKKPLKILTKEKGINLKFLCNKANLNYSLINKLNSDIVKDIGTEKKQALIKVITELYL